MHNDPNDPDYVSVTVRIRDKRMDRAGGENYHRVRIPVWQHFTGNRFGEPWIPRQGDMVYVAFFKNEKAFVVASAYNVQHKPVCMPGSDLDKICKTCQWERATKRNETKEFMEVPEGLHPRCHKWFNGPNTDVPTIGRDYMDVGDFCQEGHEDPTCQKCDSIDFVKRCNNSWLKEYSTQTMSCQAPNKRVERHFPCGSYWRWDSEAGNSVEYSEGKSHHRFGNAVCEADKRAHLNLQGSEVSGDAGVGTWDIHTDHEECGLADEHLGIRRAGVRREDMQVDWSWEDIDFTTMTSIRGYKDGRIEITSLNGASKITVDGTKNKVTIEGTKIVEIDASEEIILDSPLTTITGDLHVEEDEQVDGTCSGPNNVA